MYEKDMVRTGIPPLRKDVDKGEEEIVGDETASDESDPFSWKWELECGKGSAFGEREWKPMGKMAPHTTILRMI